MKLVVAALKEFVKKYFQDMDIFHFAIFCLEISNMPVESSPEAEISIWLENSICRGGKNAICPK